MDLKQLRGQIFAWFGIVGSVITLIGNLQSIIYLANWCNYIVLLYKSTLQTISEYLNIHLKLGLDPSAIGFLFYLFFLTSMSIGSRIMSDERHQNLRSRAIIFSVLLLINIVVYRYEFHIFPFGGLENVYYSMFVMILLSAYALNLANINSQSHIFHILALSILLYLGIYVMSTGKFINPFEVMALSDVDPAELLSTDKLGNNVNWIILLVACVLMPTLPHFIAPFSALLKRCIFVAIGVAIVLLLSEVTKLLAT